jgi:hypothetical protein
MATRRLLIGLGVGAVAVALAIVGAPWLREKIDEWNTPL